MAILRFPVERTLQRTMPLTGTDNVFVIPTEPARKLYSRAKIHSANLLKLDTKAPRNSLQDIVQRTNKYLPNPPDDTPPGGFAA